MLEAQDLSAGFRGQALFRNLNLQLRPGCILGLNGASGAGKTTLGLVLAGLHPPLAGKVRLGGHPLPQGQGRAPVQYLHQDPILAMNPRWRIRRVLAEAGHPDPSMAAILGIESPWLDRFPHELSGGQLQRISLLRALTASPRYLIADEISAALDPLSQARIWAVLRDLITRRGIGLLAISHDRNLLGHIADQGVLSL